MNTNFFRFFSIAVILVLVFFVVPTGVWAWGDISDDDQFHFIQRFDQDGDDLVSQDEFPGPLEHFNRLDNDGDGYIDAEEAPHRPPHGNRGGKGMLADFDADDDGQLTLAEFPGPEEHFEELDMDGDGFLDSQELSAGRLHPPHGNGFERDDVDQDGLVSRDEFGGPDELFDRLDADGDDYITRQEARFGDHHNAPGEAPGTGDEQH